MGMLSCISDYKIEHFPPLNEQNVISEILQENGVYVNNIRNKLLIYYYDWPDDDEEEGYEILIDDTSIHKLVLSATINLLSKSEYFQGMNISYEVAMKIDSIDVRTDSVVLMQKLDLSQCNLTHLPPEIGKMRVSSLDISYNYTTLMTLPDELMQLSESPRYWDTLIVNYDIGAVNGMVGVSDTLKSWLQRHAAQK